MDVLNKRLLIISISVMLLLLLPLKTMLFSNEINWSLIDFLIAGIILFSTDLLLEFIYRRVKKKEIRIVLFIIALLLLILIWAELAVGVFRSPFAGS